MSPSESSRLARLLVFEEELWAQGFCHVAGVDEVGRGALAGPVVAAACILARGTVVEGADDSKRLTALQREAVYDRMVAQGIVFAVGFVEAGEIDQLGIVPAIRKAMTLALEGLSLSPDALLVDGRERLQYKGLPSRSLVGGDGKSQSIALASIAAKVRRDAWMRELHEEFPQFGWKENVGYGTAFHRKRLKECGPTKEHRTSYAPVREVACQSS